MRPGRATAQLTALSLLGSGYDHIDLTAAAFGADQPIPSNWARAFRCRTEQPSRRDRAQVDAISEGKSG